MQWLLKMYLQLGNTGGDGPNALYNQKLGVRAAKFDVVAELRLASVFGRPLNWILLGKIPGGKVTKYENDIWTLGAHLISLSSWVV